jgi:hypothetical protein
MPGENKDRQRTAQIVMAYLRHHKLSGDQVGTLILDVPQTLGKLGQAPEPEAERVPAVSIRRSVQQDAVTCIECGWKGRMLRRHLATRHGSQPRRISGALEFTARPSPDRTGIFRTPVGAGKAAWTRAQWARRESPRDRNRIIASSAATPLEAELEISA